MSYYWMSDVTPQNIDRHIAYARQGGFRTAMIFYSAFATTPGHFPWRPEYPHGIEDLQSVVRKIKDAGMVPGLHFHYNKTFDLDPYVSPKPDPRLNLRRLFTLTVPLGGNPVEGERASGSEANVYRVLKRHGLSRTIVLLGFPASKEFRVKTTAPNPLWQSDASYFFVVGWGWTTSRVSSWPAI